MRYSADGASIVDQTLQGLTTRVRLNVILSRGAACLRLFRARWPHASFDEAIVIDWAWNGPNADGRFVPDPVTGKNAMRQLATLRGQTLVCVDHSSIHYGSVFDLDTLVQQSGCSLHSVLPGPHLHPEVDEHVLDAIDAEICPSQKAGKDRDQLPRLRSRLGPT